MVKKTAMEKQLRFLFAMFSTSEDHFSSTMASCFFASATRPLSWSFSMCLFRLQTKSSVLGDASECGEKLTNCLDPITSTFGTPILWMRWKYLHMTTYLSAKEEVRLIENSTKWIWWKCHGLQCGVFLFNKVFLEFVHFTQD